MKTRFFLLMILLALTLSGCFLLEGGYTLSPTLTAEARQTQAALAAPTPTLQPQVMNPLTGLPAADPTLLERRPVMVKVSNHPQSGRPHAGLSFADMVFDYYIGNGQNRFLAVFYGQDSSLIGPVRSGRFVDAQLVTMYGGVLGYGSADEDTDAELVTRLGAYAINNMEAPCPAFCGESTHDATGVFANSRAISEYVVAQGLEDSSPDLPGILFSETLPPNGQPGQQLLVKFNYKNIGEWRYDAASGKYLRWIEQLENPDDIENSKFEMVPLVDRVNGQQLAFSNVVIVQAEITELAPTRHLMDLWGNDSGQPAYFFRDGLLYQGKWRAQNDSDPIQFLDQNGNPYPLKPGNTWVVIAGLSSSFKQVQSGQWEMFFFLP